MNAENPETELYSALDELCGGVAAFIANQSEMNAGVAPGLTEFTTVAMPPDKVWVRYLVEVNGDEGVDGDLVPEPQWEIKVDSTAQRARAVVHETMMGRLNVDGDADATREATETVRQAVRQFHSGAMDDAYIVSA